MLRGINVVDFCRLESLEGNYIRYRRSKTGRLYEIRVEPEARRLIDRLRGKGQLLYPLDRVADYRRYTARLNAALKRIATGIPGMPPITTYWARHSWATIAASLDIPKETIAAALGHAPTSVTDIYISFDTRKIHTANRKIIKHVFGPGKAVAHEATAAVARCPSGPSPCSPAARPLPCASCIFRKIKEGQGNSLHRADGGSSDGKRGIFPLLSPLRDF